MTVEQRPTPLFPVIETWAELAAYLDRRMAALDADCYDDETIQSIGQTPHYLSLGKRSGFVEVRMAIAPLVEAEAAERAATAHVDGIEAAFKSAGYTGDPKLALVERGNDGDR